MKNSGVIAHTDKKSVTEPSLLPLASTSMCSLLLCFMNINVGMILIMYITAMIVSNKRFMFIEFFLFIHFKIVRQRINTAQQTYCHKQQFSKSISHFILFLLRLYTIIMSFQAKFAAINIAYEGD